MRVNRVIVGATFTLLATACTYALDAFCPVCQLRNMGQENATYEVRVEAYWTLDKTYHYIQYRRTDRTWLGRLFGYDRRWQYVTLDTWAGSTPRDFESYTQAVASARATLKYLNGKKQKTTYTYVHGF